MEDINYPRPSKVAMALVYRILWSKLPKKSIVSGLWLREYERTPLFPNCFLSVLDPEKYPYFRYYLKNVVLVTPGERGLWMQGTEEERLQYALNIEEQGKGNTANWSVVKDLEVVLQAEYKKYFPTTRGIFINYSYSLWEQKRIIGTLNEKYILSSGS
jgi:hypothetical protein